MDLTTTADNKIIITNLFTAQSRLKRYLQSKVLRPKSCIRVMNLKQEQKSCRASTLAIYYK